MIEAAAHVNVIFSEFVTKHTALSSRCSVFWDHIKNTALADRFWAKIAHIYMQELPEQKHSELFVSFHLAVSQVLKLSQSSHTLSCL